MLSQCLSHGISLTEECTISLVTNHYTRRANRRHGDKAARVLEQSAIDGSEWSASCSGRFTHEEREPVVSIT
jgi:hypothetical protein